jgi:hypothetical protein
MGREPEIHLDFPARYELAFLERLRPLPDSKGYARSLGFPGGGDLDPQQELAEPPILAVRPSEGYSWIGTFRGGGVGAPPAALTQVVGMPDEVSICVVKHGAAYIVRTDDPSSNLELDLFPVCDVLGIREQRLVIFGDFIRLIAYGEHGVVWRSEQLVLDDLKIVRAEGDVLHLSGSGIDNRTDFTVDLRSGQSPDQLFSEAWGR